MHSGWPRAHRQRGRCWGRCRSASPCRQCLLRAGQESAAAVEGAHKVSTERAPGQPMTTCVARRRSAAILLETSCGTSTESETARARHQRGQT
eukprot:4771465-Pleurochrysis_carterae.AAC.1